MTAITSLIENAVALTEGRWTQQGKRVESDLSGVSFLRMDLSGARVEVYSDREGFGGASVIVGSIGYLTAPTPEMRRAFGERGCVDIYSAAE